MKLLGKKCATRFKRGEMCVWGETWDIRHNRGVDEMF